MAEVKLLDKPEDFARLGINANGVELWEDGRRNFETTASCWEWWYSDFIFDDGTTAVIQFFTKGSKHARESGDHPAVSVRITLPDGKKYFETLPVDVKDASFSDKECDNRLGGHFFTGDLKEYHIHVEPTESCGTDLTLVSRSTPYRPGTAYFEMGGPGKYYTWLCVVPKGEATGTLTLDGKTREVRGFGYHDHQWGNTNFLGEWNHWLWARQSFDDYSMLTFDLVGSKKNKFSRFPVVFIQDKDGKLVFENTHGVDCEVLGEYHDDEASDKDYPKELRYVFESNGKKVIYHLKEKKILETGGTKTITGAVKLMVKLMGIKLSYTRYLADGELTLTDGEKTIQRSGELIYEFMFPGDSFHGHM